MDGLYERLDDGERILKMIDTEWLNKAIETIKSGICDKLEKGDITIYRCGKIIRIDIKGV